MEKHQELIETKFQHAEEDLLYNSGGNVMWSLFRTQSGGVNIYYHDKDEFQIISGKKAKYHSLKEIADAWDSSDQKLDI